MVEELIIFIKKMVEELIVFIHEWCNKCNTCVYLTPTECNTCVYLTPTEFMDSSSKEGLLMKCILCMNSNGKYRLEYFCIELYSNPQQTSSDNRMNHLWIACKYRGNYLKGSPWFWQKVIDNWAQQPIKLQPLLPCSCSNVLIGWNWAWVSLSQFICISFTEVGLCTKKPAQTDDTLENHEANYAEVDKMCNGI